MSLGQSVHYEIVGRRGSSWTILEVIKDRKAAVTKAEELWNSKRYTGIKVCKESYNKATHEFSSIEIYSRGGQAKKSKYDQTGTISPCLTPDDLYSADGRRSIWELLGNTLTDWKITPTELLHSLEHYYKLFNAGTKLQNAVQRTAVSYEHEQGSIQERMRKLYKVIDQSIEIMKANQGNLPSLEMGRLKPIIDQLQTKSNKRFLLTSALTEYLRPAVTLSDKVGRTIIFLAAGRPSWVIEILDQFIAEFMLHPPVAFQLLGEPEDRAQFIIWLTHLHAGQLSMMGETEHSACFSDEVLRLNGFMSQGKMPRTARVLLARLETEIEASKPISQKGLVDQLKRLNTIKETLVKLIEDDGQLEGLESALSKRSARLLNSQAVGEMLHDLKSPIDQMDALLDLEKFTIGHQNKRMVANFILPILTRPEYEAVFVGLDDHQPIQRMGDLTRLQQRINEADLTEMHKRKIAEKLDSFCRAILDNTQVLKKLHALDISLQEKSKKILGMLADGFFTVGDCRNRAEHQVRIYMKQPGFTEGLIMGKGRDNAEKELLDFRALLDRAGISKPAEVSPDHEDAIQIDQSENDGFDENIEQGIQQE